MSFLLADGDTSLIPDNRTYKLVFERRTEAAADKVKVSVDGKDVWAKNKYDKENRKLIVTVNASTAEQNKRCNIERHSSA